MRILVPTPITPEMIDPATTLAEPGPDEIVWTANAAYSVGQARIRLETHRVYQCVQDHTGRAAAPENDPAYWLDYAPTNRYAPYDDMISTAALAKGSMTIVLRLGFFNAVPLFGLTGNDVRIRVTADGGNTVVHDQSATLRAPPDGWYDWLFGPYRTLDRFRVANLMPYPDAVLEITIDAGDPDALCGVGLIAVGDYRNLLDGAEFGGALNGASAEPVDYSSIKTDEFGRTVIKRRHSGTGMRVSVLLPRVLADYALSCMRDVLGVPAVFTAIDRDGFDGLSCFGLASGSLRYEDITRATLDITVQGLI